jgi:hypothetical protein
MPEDRRASEDDDSVGFHRDRENDTKFAEHIPYRKDR